MARKAKKARSSRAIAARSAAGFEVLAMHVTEKRGRRAFEALRADRPASNTFALRESLPKNLDAESAAKRILAHAFASRAMPSLTAPMVSDEQCDFRSLGVETVPLTGTTVVKFRQQIRGIPVFGSLVSVELDDHNEPVSLNSSLAQPDLASYVARISPLDALKRIAARAGYGSKLPDGVPALNVFLDHRGKWHLAYIVEDVRSRSKGKASKGHQIPLVFDYVIDARNGALVAELPRTPAARHGTASARDELGRLRTFDIELKDGKRVMRDAVRNIETCDFGYRNPVGGKLPGNLASSPWSPAAVSAHTHAATVTEFLRKVLKRNNIDNMGGRVVSTVNCVVKQFEEPPGSRVWLNAFWDGAQMLYGQEQLDDGQLRSMASSLSVVAHELFHGVTGATARLVYLGETGALNESYSDIFGTLIANGARPDITEWKWQVGCGVETRDMQDPTLHGQPRLMKHFIDAPLTPKGDLGGVHFNSGIHNYAAFKVMSAKDGRKFIFRPHELAAMFYVALTQQLSRQSTFADSRRGVVLATRSLFRKLPERQIERRVAAVNAGFDAAGIR
jgi:Zn-dependent metalloprotease